MAWLLKRRVRAEVVFERRDEELTDHYVMTLGTKDRPGWTSAHVVETERGWFVRAMAAAPTAVNVAALQLLKTLPRRKALVA